MTARPSADPVVAAAPPARSSRPSAALVAAAGAVVVALVGVRGEFPLNDDWSYAHAVRSLCETGTLDLLPWTGPSLILQLWAGAAVCTAFGFSFTLLRALTLVAAVAGAVGFVRLAREVRAPAAPLLLATVVFALDPLYVNLAFTFMTEVPLLALVVWSSLYYVRGLRDGDLRRLTAASGLCAAGVLVRQHAILVAGAAALVALVARPGPLAVRLRAAGATLALPLAAFVAYHAWLFGVHGAPSSITIRLTQQSAVDPLELADVTFRSLAYLGLLTLPLAVAALPTLRRRQPVLLATAAVVVGTTAAFLYRREGALMFYLGNVLYDFGVGALTLRDTLFLGHEPPVHGGALVQAALTVAAVVGAAALLTAAADALRRPLDAASAFAAAAFGSAVAGAALTQSRLYLDRHVLTALPFAILLLLPPAAGIRRRAWPAWAAAAALAWFAVAGTHDYLAWNRTRYALLHDLETAGIAAAEIDGGVEYNAWRFAAELRTWPTMAEARRGQPADRRSWWWVQDDRFVVSFRPLPGYRVHARREYARWLVPGRGTVFALEREPRADAGTPYVAM